MCVHASVCMCVRAICESTSGTGAAGYAALNGCVSAAIPCSPLVCISQLSVCIISKPVSQYPRSLVIACWQNVAGNVLTCSVGNDLMLFECSTSSIIKVFMSCIWPLTVSLLSEAGQGVCVCEETLRLRLRR